MIFDTDKSELYTLSIRLSTDGFSLSAYNPEREHPFYHWTYPVRPNLSIVANVKEMLATCEQLQHPYKQVRVLFDTMNCMPVPFELFDDEDAENLYHQTFHTVGIGEMVMSDVLPDADVVLLSCLNKNVRQQIVEQYPHATFHCTVTPLTAYFAKRSHLGDNRKLFVCFQKSHLTLLAFDRRKLMLLNNFGYKTVDDCVYYVLYAWKQLELNQQQDELHLAGFIPSSEMLLHQLRKYIRQVHAIDPSAEFSRAAYTTDKELPFDLQASFACNF